MIQMTRAEYERTYGKAPVIHATSALDTTPAPIRMTREEYNSIFAEPEKKESSGLGAQLGKRVSSTVSQFGKVGAYPGQAVVHTFGQAAGAVGDVIGAALSPVFNKAVDTISDSKLVQKFATSKTGSNAIDLVNADVDKTQAGYQQFAEAFPNADQFLRDTVNILTLTPAEKLKVPKRIRAPLEERVITRRAAELAKIEDKYVKTRNANTYSKDAGAASRSRIAATDVLVNAVDENGLIRTKQPGGAVDQYRKLTIDGAENVVRKNLKLQAETLPVETVKTALIRAVSKSGLEGGDLVTAIRGIDRELQGLLLRSDNPKTIPVYKLHDAKISTTKNINYLTPPETAAYRKAVAKGYRTLVETGSTKFDVGEVNRALAPYLEDIKRLERLDGARVEGGKLGKYMAQGVGSLIGAGAGSIAGGVGAAVGTMVGGEVGAALKGKAMAGTFGKATGKVPVRNAVLEGARLKVPDKKLQAPKGLEKTKEIKSLEDDIAHNVELQKKAIAKGDFTLVQALKEIYARLVQALKDAVKTVANDLTGPDSQRGFANFFGDQSPRKKSLMSPQNQAPKAPTIAHNISPKVSQGSVPSRPVGVLSERAIKYLHPDDITIMEKYIDSVRNSEITLTPQEEHQAYLLIEHFGMKADGDANAIARRFEDILHGSAKFKPTNISGRPFKDEPE